MARTFGEYLFACTLQYQLEVLPGTPLTCKPVLHLHNRWGILATMAVRSGGQGLRRQQQRPKGQRVQAAQHYELIPHPPNFNGKDACVHPGCP